MSKKEITMTQIWVRIEGTTKEEFKKFCSEHQDFIGSKIKIYEFGSGIVVCIDIKDLIQHFGMPEQLNPENYAMFFSEKQDGASHIRLRLSSGIGVNKALEVQL